MPESKIIGTRYVLAVQDLNKSLSYYENQLGFKLLWKVDGWVCIRRESFEIMLGECPADVSAFDTNNHSYFAYIDVEAINLIFEELKQKKIEIISNLADKPWGQREFGIRTIDGHRIMFGEEIE
ncbi:VOC family protein [Ekhidna sp.]|uniref:VOC family protein n=1 Tax=Ekhidna sp. TaxID=2608089 RepID=UPI0032EE2952